MVSKAVRHQRREAGAKNMQVKSPRPVPLAVGDRTRAKSFELVLRGFAFLGARRAPPG